MDDHYPKRVADYTQASLVMLFVNLLWIFVALWSLFGIGPVLILAAVLNHLISRLERLRRRKRG
ncbi:hypothetical protein [Pseudoponticoccus marisrubri]|uniref:Histidinol phosphate aminotransferase n=1 Tax=Pseudoponticoccus marisrubri TaxID=1685382 RepID=A0A0W7WIJ7_9RHOB|nr:hypothetical protein [Pseudoponticoccus marisrubri]KUF10353.1 hypothetical protein AVJ23_13200 [Pseudoponticoccus marisrubri]